MSHALISGDKPHQETIDAGKGILSQPKCPVRYISLLKDLAEAVHFLLRRCGAVLGLLLHCIDAVAVLSVLLHAVKGMVCKLEQLIIIPAELGNSNRTHGYAEGNVHILPQDRLCTLQKLFIHHFGKCSDPRLFSGAGHKARELIPANPPAHIFIREMLSHQVSETFQNGISEIMAIEIVHQLKAVQVDHQKVALLFGTGLGQGTERTALVQKSRHLIHVGFLGQITDLLPAVQDILYPAEQHVRAEGLMDEVRCTQVKALALGFLCVICRHIHDGDLIAVGFQQGLMHLEAVHARHQKVCQDHIRFLLRIDIQCFPCVIRTNDLVLR